MRLFSCKRGNWQDILEYSKGILVLGISILIGMVFLSAFNNSFISLSSTTPILNDSIALDNMSRAVDNYHSTDYIIPILFVFFLGFSAWSARKIESSHKFVFVGVIMYVIVVLFSFFVEVMWDSFSTQASVISILSGFPLTNFFISYLRYFVLIYGLIVGVALYAKDK